MTMVVRMQLGKPTFRYVSKERRNRFWKRQISIFHPHRRLNSFKWWQTIFMCPQGYYDKREMPQPGFYAPYPGGGGGAGQPAIYPQQSPYPPPPPQQPGSQYPPPGLQYPSSGPQYPSLGLQHPSPGMQYPSPGLQYPSSGLQYPSPSTCPYPSPMPPPPPLSTGLPYSPYPGQYPQPASHSTDDAGFGDDSFRAPVQDPSVQEKVRFRDFVVNAAICTVKFETRS